MKYQVVVKMIRDGKPEIYRGRVVNNISFTGDPGYEIKQDAGDIVNFDEVVRALPIDLSIGDVITITEVK
jgi:hypothetical protein